MLKQFLYFNLYLINNNINHDSMILDVQNMNYLILLQHLLIIISVNFLYPHIHIYYYL